jgi:xanthine dehydrogenase accessory factor
MTRPRPLVCLRGGGDLATGVAARLHRSGFAVAVLEIPQPLAVRRTVALAEAVYAGETRVEELVGRRVASAQEALAALGDAVIPVLVDPQFECRSALRPAGIIDARMLKRTPSQTRSADVFLAGLGPGFEAGVNCDAVVETQRGHYLGRVYWQGSGLPDTGVPDPVIGYDVDRVLRAPAAGEFRGAQPIGARLAPGDLIARVDGAELRAPFAGVLRGLLHDGLPVEAGLKVGDLDPRAEPSFCRFISDKSLAVGGGVLEALLSRPDIRARLAG